jgi:hypothetical protein
MPRLTEAHWRRLQELAGLPGEADVGKVFAAAAERLRRPRFDPRRRDQVIAAAVAAGKFSVDRVGFYASLWESDPAGTERLITNLAAVGSPSSRAALDFPDPTGVGADIAHLWPPGSRAEQEQRWAWEDSQASAAAGLTDAEYLQLFPDEQ